MNWCAAICRWFGMSCEPRGSDGASDGEFVHLNWFLASHLGENWREDFRNIDELAARFCAVASPEQVSAVIGDLRALEVMDLPDYELEEVIYTRRNCRADLGTKTLLRGNLKRLLLAMQSAPSNPLRPPSNQKSDQAIKPSEQAAKRL